MQSQIGLPNESYTLDMASHATALIKLSGVLASAQSSETFGGVEIDYTGPDHGVLAYSGIEDPTVGYSASPLLFESHLDPARPVHQVTLSAPGLKLGSPDPVMLFPAESYFTPYAYLHNVSANPLQVTLSLVSAGSGGPPQTFALGQVSLQPGETSHFDIASQFSSVNSMPDGNAHLTASFQGRDGDLELAAGSVDRTETYVFEVNPSQQADSASRTICFWSVEGDNDSTITIWNYKAMAQDLVLTLYYFQGQYAVPIHLGANESYTLDMASLVHSRAPDPSGTVIPANIVMGSAMLAGKGGETDTISVAVSASVFNVRNATCNSLCEQCNGATSVGFDPGSYAEAVGGTAQALAQVTWNSGNTYTNPSGTTFASGNISIARIGQSGILTGVTPGTTGVSFALDDYPIYEVSCNGYIPCTNGNLGGGGPDDVTPTIIVGSTTTIPLSALIPTYLTGVGIVAAMQVEPSSQDFNSYTFTESVTNAPGSNSCPSNFGNQCSTAGGSTSFTPDTAIIEPLTFEVFPAVDDVFYDIHETASTVNYLEEDEANDGGLTSCSVTCSQTYFWNGNPVNSFSITRNFSLSAIGPASVTIVNVTKVPQ